MKLSPEWITGFVDGEGCFHVGIVARSDMGAGAQVLPELTVVQHERDAKVLHALKAFFGCGVVRVNHDDRLAWRVRDRRHLLEQVIPFFERHPLKTTKRVAFLRFRRVLHMMERGEHLTVEGVERIRAVAAGMNRGQSR